MKLVIVPLALAELHDAAAFYTASANAELGFAFLAEFERTTAGLLANPELGAVRQSRRRYVLRRFPFSVFYHRWYAASSTEQQWQRAAQLERLGVERP